VTVSIGMPTQGQGIETALAQVCAGVLGVDPRSDVRVVSHDTETTPKSPVGAVASRGAAVGGSAVALATRELAERLRERAAARLRATPEAVTLRDGHASAGGASIAFSELAPLEGRASVDPEAETFSYGAHVAMVDVDPETGVVDVVRYAAVTDCGTLINPAIVRGQVEGGVVQGIGGALMEELRFGPEGEPLAETLFDYAIPTAADVPAIDVQFLETPTDRTATGARGGGEVGIIGPGAAIAGAVWRALGGTVAPTALPLTPERVRRLAQARDSGDSEAAPGWVAFARRS
jgi:carbon-monoxide dehydrogenase large subunit